jgi:hypothetical protein
LRLFRRRDPDPPVGLRLVLDDGRVIPCDVLRDPDLDRDGCAAWVVVPRDPDLIVTMRGALEADVIPARTSLHFRLRVRDGG